VTTLVLELLTPRLLLAIEWKCMVLAELEPEPLRRGVPTGSSDILCGGSKSGIDGPREDGDMLKTSLKLKGDRIGVVVRF
jgi:hypothetical protein